MKKEEMNKVITMLDDDVIADALEGSQSASRPARRRGIFTAMIAAVLAVAMIAGAAVAMLRRPAGGAQSILPPEGATIIRMSRTVQLTPETVFTSGNYYAQTAYKDLEAGRYASVGGLELDGALYDSLVASNDAGRTWALEVTVSPNLYITKDYIEKEAEYWMSRYEIEDLGALAGIYSQLNADYDINALYEQYKDTYDLDVFYKYYASGQLESDLLAQDIGALSTKAEQIWDDCVSFQRDYWKDISKSVAPFLDAVGIDYLEDEDRFIIFVTEGELMSLQGISGVKFSKAGKYDLGLGQISRLTEWQGKLITNELAEAINANGSDVLFAVTAEPAVFGQLLDRAGYEEEYVAVVTELAKRPASRALLEAAAQNSAKFAEAVEVCGIDTVTKYIQGNVFDSALYDADTAAMTEKMNEMRENLYGTADKYYEVFSSQVRYIEVKANGNVILYVTADELAAIKTESEYCYKLAQ